MYGARALPLISAQLVFSSRMMNTVWTSRMEASARHAKRITETTPVNPTHRVRVNFNSTPSSPTDKQHATNLTQAQRVNKIKPTCTRASLINEPPERNHPIRGSGHDVDSTGADSTACRNDCRDLFAADHDNAGQREIDRRPDR